jgi:hypothetical protein
MNQDKITTFFRLPSLRLTELKTKLADADKKYPTKLSSMTKAYLFGIEVEVENVPNPVDSLNYWKLTHDNSLRNHGYEYVSRPLRANQIEGAIQELTESLPPDHTFSERTSCHVHMNVRDLTISEIYNLIIIYMVVENVLFKWVGHERDENIFCLPLNETKFYQQIEWFQNNIRETIRNWNKYTALNLLPIQDKGTIEFRHMYGNLNPEILLNWINLLCCIKDTAKRWNTSKLETYIKNLNTNSEYHLFLTEIFGGYTSFFENYNLQDMMEKPVSQLKLTFPKPNQSKQQTEFMPIPNVDWGLEVDRPVEPQVRPRTTNRGFTTRYNTAGLANANIPNGFFVNPEPPTVAETARTLNEYIATRTLGRQ